MKNKLIALLALTLLGAFNSTLSTTYAQGTAFTYQGRLNNGTNPASGTYNLTFSLYNLSTGGSVVAGPVTNNAVSVTNGLFSVLINFASGVFTGQTNWLQIGVETNGAGSFTTLTPLQQLTPTPYAIYAESAGSTALLSDPGTANLYVGPGAGPATTFPAAIQNTGEGYGALNANILGYDNTANGYEVLSVNTQGAQNTANGANALSSNSSGNNNSANGFNALAANSSGGGNTANGVDALLKNNGFNNTANGVNALQNNTIGGVNVADGGQALYSNTIASHNTAVGWQALYGNTTGSNNVAVGDGALRNSTTDNGLVAMGYQALENDAVVSSFFNSSGNTAVGYQALMLNTTGSGNTAIGYDALDANVIGYNNTASGWLALANNTGNNNTANGFSALSANSTGTNNTAYGQGALSGNTTAGNNTAIGANALSGGPNVTGGGNTGSGGSALADLTIGYNNTAAGYEALTSDQDGVDNVGIGVATFQVLDGSLNTGVGTYAFQQMTSGSGNIGLGYHAGYNLRSGTNNIYIGSLGSSSESGIIRIGTPGTQTGAYLAGSLWLDGSDANNGLTYMTSGLNGVPGGAGPFLFGYNGGSLGTADPNLPALSWDYNGNVWVSNNCSVATLTIRGGADLAEPFNITAGKGEVPQGAVVVIDDQNPGQLTLTDQPYDTRVAGVVSGANGINPGIQMHQQGLLEGGKNVALSGRVYVQADTSNGAIKPGDLLTTSSTPGRAMRVSDHVRAQGAILGKAMTALNEGKGMVLVLVTLQ